MNYRSLIATAALALSAGAAKAQGMGADDIIGDTAAGASAQLIVPLIILAFVTLALSSDGGTITKK